MRMQVVEQQLVGSVVEGEEHGGTVDGNLYG